MPTTRGLGAYDDGTPENPGAGTTPRDVRLALAGLFVPTLETTRVGAFPGVLPVANSMVVGTDAFAYVVRGFHVVTTRGAGDGAQLWGNDGDVTLTTADDGSSLTAPGAGLQRIDIVYALHPTNTENGDTTSQPRVAVAKGAPDANPLAPSIPPGAVELARNTMTSAATSTASTGNAIVLTYRRTALRGTPLVVRNHTEREFLRLNTQAGPWYPLWVWCQADNQYEVCFDGTNFTPLAYQGSWTTYTPSWLAATNPNFGVDGALIGEYLLEGKRCRANIQLSIGGSGASGGSGMYSLTLPFASPAAAGMRQAVNGWLITAGNRRTISGIIEPGSAAVTQMITGTGASFDSSFALAGGAIIVLNADYRIA